MGKAFEKEMPYLGGRVGGGGGGSDGGGGGGQPMVALTTSDVTRKNIACFQINRPANEPNHQMKYLMLRYRCTPTSPTTLAIKYATTQRTTRPALSTKKITNSLVRTISMVREKLQTY